jgi:cytochrome b involved in lipid metabolism
MSLDKALEIRDKMFWTVIDGDIYDITNYVGDHPGGFK